MRVYLDSQMTKSNRSARNSHSRRTSGLFPPVSLMVCSLALLLVCGNSPLLHAQSVEEHEAKAAFVLKVVNFVEWPSTANHHNSNLVICIIGADATSDALQRLAFGKAVDGREIIVRRSSKEAGTAECQVVFIGESEHAHVSTLLQQARGTNVLTVGEEEGFARLGGIVNLTVADGRIRLEVNERAAERAHLQISSRLLSLATIVADGS